MPGIVKEYVDTGKVKLVWNDFAWIGNESRQAAQAARCAGRQGKFWEYHDHLYEHQRGENAGQFSSANLKQFAATLGLDTASFNSCLNQGEDLADIQQDLADARAKGIRATPSFAINGQVIPGGSAQSLRAALDAALATTGG